MTETTKILTLRTFIFPLLFHMGKHVCHMVTLKKYFTANKYFTRVHTYIESGIWHFFSTSTYFVILLSDLTDAPKTSHNLVGMLVQKHNWSIFSSKMSKERPIQSMAIVIGPCWTNFCSQKLKRRILAIFGLNRTALRTTKPKLHSMFCAMFLKITLSAAELMLFGHLGAAIWRHWTIICRKPSKISVTLTSQRQLTL